MPSPRPLADPARLRAVRATGLLDSLPEEAFDRYARLARRALRSDQALVNVVDADRQFTKACVGGEDLIPLAAGDSLPVAGSFCAVVVAADRPVVARDTREEPLFADVDDRSLRVVPGYIGAPLHAPTGEVIGTLCAMSTAPHDWSDDDVETLLELRDSVETEVALRSALAEASRRTRELEERSQGIETLHAALGAAGEDWASARTSATRAAAQAAHELRTPLVAMRNLAEDLGADAPEGLRADVRTMQATAEEALRLVNDQLAVARGVVGRPPTRVEDVDVAALFVALRGMTEPLRGAKPIALELDPGDVGVLRTDGLRLAQVLRNLLANAMRVLEAGTVRVHAARAPEDAATAVFTVADDGPGIARADQERIFAPFEQVAEHAAGGSGLGLPLSRRFAGLLGGTLTVDSAPGEGATFTLRIPAELEPGGARRAPAA